MIELLDLSNVRVALMQTWTGTHAGTSGTVVQVSAIVMGPNGPMWQVMRAVAPPSASADDLAAKLGESMGVQAILPLPGWRLHHA